MSDISLIIGGIIVALAFAIYGRTLAKGRIPTVTHMVIASGLCALVAVYGMFIVSSAQAAAVPAPVVATSPISIPWGNLLSELLVQNASTILLVVSVIIAWIFSKLPKQLVVWLKAVHADVLLNRAVNQAIAMTAGAVKGKTVEVTVANQLISTALALMVTDAPKLLDQWGPRAAQIVAGKLADLNMLGTDASSKTLQLRPDADAGSLR